MITKKNQWKLQKKLETSFSELYNIKVVMIYSYWISELSGKGRNKTLRLSHNTKIIKYTTALKERTAEPEAILRRFTRSNIQHPTYKALIEQEKAVKTVFLNYLRSEQLRQEIST